MLLCTDTKRRSLLLIEPKLTNNDETITPRNVVLSSCM